MRKLIASLKKESFILLNDKVGLLLMFMMPIFLVFIITLVQDSTFKLVSENKIDILINNKDNGTLGDTLISFLKKSGAFEIQVNRELSNQKCNEIISSEKKLLAIVIPANFSNNLEFKSRKISNKMLSELGLEITKSKEESKEKQDLIVFYDPVLQENYRLSMGNIIASYIGAIENQTMVSQLYKEMGYENVPSDLMKMMYANQTKIKQIPSSTSESKLIPNATQHNIPAWSIFAMFFMVVSLGGNIVKEKTNGSFIRLKTIPTSFSLLLVSKLFIYLFVSLLQLSVIFSIGYFIFPLIGLPQLTMPDSIFKLLVVAIACALAAISYAMLIGIYFTTQEQANGFGAVSIIIFAAIGGIWVPTFVMPEFLQNLSMVSPLHWCLEQFYTLFLRAGTWSELSTGLLVLFSFSFVCLLLIILKLKKQKLI